MLESPAQQVEQQEAESEDSETAMESDIFYSRQSRDEIVDRYGWWKTFNCLSDVGWLRVKALRADALTETDVGKNSPFLSSFRLLLRLGSVRRCSGLLAGSTGGFGETVAFELPVADLHEPLLLSLRATSTTEEWHAPPIRLTRLFNGARRWLPLAPRGAIQLELDLVYNPVRAALRTFRPASSTLIRLRQSRRQQRRHAAQIIAKTADDVARFGAFCLGDGEFKGGHLAIACRLAVAWNFELRLLPATLASLMLTSLAYRLAEAHFQPAATLKARRRSSREEAESPDALPRVLSGIAKAGNACWRLGRLADWTVEPRLSALALAMLAVVAVAGLWLSPTSLLRLLATTWIVGGSRLASRPLRAVSGLLDRLPDESELMATEGFD